MEYTVFAFIFLNLIFLPAFLNAILEVENNLSLEQ